MHCLSRDSAGLTNEWQWPAAMGTVAGCTRRVAQGQEAVPSSPGVQWARPSGLCERPCDGHTVVKFPKDASLHTSPCLLSDMLSTSMASWLFLQERVIKTLPWR